MEGWEALSRIIDFMGDHSNDPDIDSDLDKFCYESTYKSWQRGPDGWVSLVLQDGRAVRVRDWKEVPSTISPATMRRFAMYFYNLGMSATLAGVEKEGKA